MARAYSVDLRERLVAAVLEGGVSRHQAAERFEVSVSTALKWVDRYQRTGSVAPGKMGGHKPKKIAGPHADWLRHAAERTCDAPCVAFAEILDTISPGECANCLVNSGYARA